MLDEIIKNCFKKAQDQKAAEGYIKLERGFATIPLPGIDVPFHSRYLWAGVMPFRACKYLCLRFYSVLFDVFYRSFKEN